MRLLLLNAFSINMLPGNANLRFTLLPAEDLPVYFKAWSYERRTGVAAIGHVDTARVVAGILADTLATYPLPGWPRGARGIECVQDIIDAAAERRSVTFTPGDVALVAQYRGPRLPEGATELPEGAMIQFWKVVCGAACVRTSLMPRTEE